MKNLFAGTYHQRYSFCFGTLFGLVISIILYFLTTMSFLISGAQITRFHSSNNLQSYIHLADRFLVQTINADKVNNNLKSSLNVKPVLIDDKNHHQANDSTAKDLVKKVRVLCWILTSPQNLNIKASHVKNTWAKRCNIALFFSSETNASFPAIGLNVSEGRKHLTAKSMKAFRYIYYHYKDKADWFLKADDDTYVILENLRYLLKDYNSSDPVYFGHHFKTFNGYNSGGAGYVLSLEALTRLFFVGKNDTLCQQDGVGEDKNVGLCLQKCGVKIMNSTDAMGRSRFHCFTPSTHLSKLYPEWYYNYDANGARGGAESISDYAISFHYLKPEDMYELEYFIYHLRPYGIESRHQHLNVQIKK